MKILALTLNKFKDLHDFKIEFDDSKRNSNNSSLTFLLGDNGSGKTSIFEAIMLIFASFYSPILNDKYPFEYSIRYILNDLEIELCKSQSNYFFIKRGTNQNYTVSISGIEDSNKIKFDCFSDYRNEIINNESDYMPQNIISSYSGINDRLNEIYKKIQRNYKTKLSKNQYKEVTYSDDELGINEKIFIHSNDKIIYLYLLLIWFGNKKTKKVLKENCNITKLSRVNIKINLKFDVIKKILPTISIEQYNLEKQLIYDTLNGNVTENLQHIKNNELGAEYLSNDKISHNGATLILYGNMEDTYIKKVAKEWRKILNIEGRSRVIYTRNKNYSHSILTEVDLQNMSNNINQLFDTLLRLKAQYQIETEVYLVKNNKEILANELSEGEYQLIKVLGILTITKYSNGLVLLDEPDIHLSPKWKYQLKK